MLNLHDPKVADAVSQQGKLIIEVLTQALKDAGDSELARIEEEKKIPSGIAKMLNNERALKHNVMGKVCEFIVENAINMPHDTHVKHSVPAETVPDHLADRIAIGECMKCSLLYFVNVLYVHEIGEDLLIPMLNVNTEESHSQTSKTASCILSTTCRTSEYLTPSADERDMSRDRAADILEAVDGEMDDSITDGLNIFDKMVVEGSLVIEDLGGFSSSDKPTEESE